MQELKMAMFYFWQSDNGRDGWTRVQTKDVPQWLLDTDVLGKLALGEMAMNPEVGKKGSPFYRADVEYLAPGEKERVAAALAERDRREAEQGLIDKRTVTTH